MRLAIGGHAFTNEDVVAAARGGAVAELNGPARKRTVRAHEVIARVIAWEQVAHGVATGFGQLATTRIPGDDVHELQQNLVRSHAVGVGPALGRDVVAVPVPSPTRRSGGSMASRSRGLSTWRRCSARPSG